MDEDMARCESQYHSGDPLRDEQPPCRSLKNSKHPGAPTIYDRTQHHNGEDSGDIMDNNMPLDAEYWKREADRAQLNLRVVQQLSREMTISHQSGNVDVDAITKNILDCMEREWEERERALKREYEGKMSDLEERYKRELVRVVEESKRLDSALVYIKGLCDAHDGVEVEGGEDDVVHHQVVMNMSQEECLDFQETVSPGIAVGSKDGFEQQQQEEEEEEEEGLTRGGSSSSVMYARHDDDALRVSKESMCHVVGYRGENPDVLTENALDRILDHPGRMYKGHSYKSKLYAEKRNATPPSWRIPSLHTRTMLLKEIQELETRLKQTKTGSPVVKGCSYPEEDDEFVRTIRALGETSPTTASVMIQHVSDSWAVQKHAGKGPDLMACTPQKSGNSNGSKKSSFLGRPPISLDEVFSSSTPLWMYQ